MTYKTIMEIGKLLKNDVAEKEKQLEMSRIKENDLKDRLDAEGVDFDDYEDLEYWEASRKRHFDQLSDARDALKEFMNHDWH